MLTGEKSKKVVTLMAVALAVFGWLIGFTASYNNSKESSHRIILSLLGASIFAIAAASLVIWASKITRWIKDGFMTNEYGFQIEPDEPKNYKSGCRRAAVTLASLAAIICASVFLELPVKLNNRSHNEYQKYYAETKKTTRPDDFDPKLPLRLKDDFWLNLHKGQFVGICVSISLFGAAIGFCIVWFAYLYLERLIMNCFAKQTD
ncbi:MAG: hypothetical protein ACYTBP_11655 [Planctomycetota bacterium]|jgi:hypothetical protein